MMIVINIIHFYLMQPFDTLDAGQFYHIYHHGVGGRDLFVEPDNYDYFLKLYDKHISPVADTYAWVLMKNHFHLLVKIKDVDDTVSSDLTGFRNLSGLKKLLPHQQFSNLFNAYSKAMNKRYGQRGALFERPFKRKRITDVEYLCNVVAYIHHNPVHHGFCCHPVEYPWCSYLTCVSDKSTKLRRDEVLEWFGDKGKFEKYHFSSVESIIEKWWKLDDET